MISLWTKLAAALSGILAILHPVHKLPHVNYGGITPSQVQMQQDAAIDPYTTEGDKLEIATASTIPEAGTDTTIVDTTQPKVTLSKFGGELQTGITYEGLAPNTTGARPFLSKNVEWSDADQTMQAVPIDALSPVVIEDGIPTQTVLNPQMEDGGVEINIILNSEPTSNVFNFSIDNADQLDFFYQPPLWQEAGLKEPTPNCTDTDCDTDGQGLSHRPDDIVGSYAVYYKNHANHIEGQTNYATGKVYEIFRPKVTDAHGAITWANLSYDSLGELSVTVPQNFLDNAAYPVIVDPTFGKTTIGGTSQAFTSANAGIGDAIDTYTAVTGDTITSYSVYADDNAVSTSVDMATYTFSGGVLVTRLAAVSTISVTSNTPQWWNSSAVSTAMTNGTTYTNAVGNFTAGGVHLFHDVVGGNQTDFGSASPLPTSWTHVSYSGNLRSMYATYTAGAAATSPAPNINTIFYQ